MDEIDIANDLLQEQIDKTIARAHKIEIVQNKSGVCWGCGEEIDNSRRWHDADCRQLWEDRQGR